MLILGIDPGFASVGYAISDIGDNVKPLKLGIIRTKKDSNAEYVSEDNVRRTKEIVVALKKIIEDLKKIDCNASKIVVESMSYPRNASNAAKMSLCWGALVAVSVQENMELIQITPQNIKKLVTGKRTAKKEEVQESLKNIFKDSDFSALTEDINMSQEEHPYDALGACYAYKKTYMIK